MELEKLVNYESKEIVLHNLKDAGCTQEMLECILTHLNEDDMKEAFKLLEQHRNELLNALHESEKQIDCLDYLVYQIRRNNEHK